MHYLQDFGCSACNAALVLSATSTAHAVNHNRSNVLSSQYIAAVADVCQSGREDQKYSEFHNLILHGASSDIDVTSEPQTALTLPDSRPHTGRLVLCLNLANTARSGACNTVNLHGVAKCFV